MVKKSLVWLYSVTTYLLWAVIIVVACVVLTLRYYVFPHAEDYRNVIANYTSQALGQRLTIGDIHASWDGMTPNFDLYKVDLYDAQNRPALQLGHVEAGISWFSLILGEPRLANLAIHKPSLTIRRAPNGEIFVAGMSMSEPGESVFPNWLIRQSSITVDKATVVWLDEQRKAPPLALNNLDLTIQSPPWEALLGHHSFGLRATPSAGSSAPIDLRGNVWGKNLDKLEDWHGTLYGKLESTDIAGWHAWVDYPLELAEGHGATQFWVEFSKAQADKVTADMLFSNVRTRLGKNTPVASFNSLAGRLGWRRLNDGEEFSGEKLKLVSTDGFDMKQGQLRVAIHETKNKENVEGEASVDQLGLESFAAFAANLPLGKELHDQIVSLAPKGHLENTKFSWTGDKESVRTYTLSSRFHDLGISPADDIPGFSGFSGTLEATEKNGKIVIASRNAFLNLKNVLRWPIPADKLDGEVTWKTAKGVTEVSVNDLAIASQHLSGSLNANYRYDGKKGGYLDLNGKFGNANGKYASFYYPMILGPETLDWLDHAILNAHAENMNVVIKGYLDDFPYADGKNGEFKVSARVTDGQLKFADDWPQLDGLQLDMLFHGKRMDLAVDHGRVYSSPITRAKVAIPDLDADQPFVTIQGEMQATAADGLKYVNSSPIAEAIDHFTDKLVATGNGKLLLDINVPIDDPEKTKVKGSFTVANGTLTGDPDLPPLDHLNGKLTFTEESLQIQNMTGNIYGGPGQFSLQTSTDGSVHITGNGHIYEDGIRQAADLFLLQKVHGGTDWTADVNVRDKLTNIAIRSQLTGLSVSLPPPLSKAAADPVSFRMDIQQKNETQDVLSLAYGNTMTVKLLRNETKDKDGKAVERGEINFGGTADIPAQSGVVVNGKVAHLDWDLWSDILEPPGSNNGTADNSDFPVNTVNIEAGTLDYLDRRINKLTLSAKAMPDGWTAQMQSKEITGEGRWIRTGKGKVIARLKSLIFPGPAPAKMGAADDTNQTQDYPALDIVADNFETKDKKLGRLELMANQQGGDWNIEKLKISNPDSTLSVDGVWHNWKRRPNTSINLNWDVTDLGKTLDRYGYPETVSGGTASLSGKLRWPGSPHEFTFPGLGGNLQLEAKHGQFLKIQPGVGRLLGVLSLQALPRRLLFDFRDVFNEGFTFDNIGGAVQINQGVMKSNDFHMEGPAAKVALSGQTDLDKETLNLHVKVSPSISDSLSIAAFAGGPAVGAAALVAQKILRDPLNKLASYQYDIGGTWDDPQELKSGAENKPIAPVPGN
jgi:uncharacterized protein (TIGR02099 family)